MTAKTTATETDPTAEQFEVLYHVAYDGYATIRVDASATPEYDEAAAMVAAATETPVGRVRVDSIRQVV